MNKERKARVNAERKINRFLVNRRLKSIFLRNVEKNYGHRLTLGQLIKIVCIRKENYIDLFKAAFTFDIAENIVKYKQFTRIIDWFKINDEYTKLYEKEIKPILYEEY